MIVNADAAKIGPVQGTGPGTPWSQKTAKKVSKPFVLKNGEFLKMYPGIGVNPGDTVCFIYF